MGADGDKIAGTVKEKVGQATGNERLEGEGQGQKNAGKVEKVVDSVKDKVHGVADAFKHKDKDHH